MVAYVTISVGTRPQDTHAVLVSDDAAVVSAAVRALIARVGGASLLEGVVDPLRAWSADYDQLSTDPAAPS
jgi:hypothetical protein